MEGDEVGEVLPVVDSLVVAELVGEVEADDVGVGVGVVVPVVVPPHKTALVRAWLKQMRSMALEMADDSRSE